MQFLVIEGNIGSGKTSLARLLAAEFNAKLILEQFAENSFLPKFYKDPERYSFPLELSFLADRYKQIKKELIYRDLFHPLVIADYFFSKTAIFARNTLKPDEFHLFRQIFDIVSDNIPKPDLYVYLHADANKLLKNIKKRGREYEQDINAEYLNSIQEGYFNYFRVIDSFPVLILDVNNFDFVENIEHFKRVKEILFKSKYKLGINRSILL